MFEIHADEEAFQKKLLPMWGAQQLVTVETVARRITKKTEQRVVIIYVPQTKC